LSSTAWLSDIYFVFWREMKRFIVQKPRVFATLFQPLIWLVLMGNMMSGMTETTSSASLLGTENYIDFMTPGVMIMTALFNGAFSGMSLIWDRRIGFLNKMLSAPISRMAVPLGKMAASALQNVFQVVVIGLVALALGVRITTGIPGFLLMTVITVLFSLAMSSISLSIATFIKTPEGFHPILNFFILPLMFTSNAIFPRGAMPGWLQMISYVNPLSYAVTPMRVLAIEGWIWEKVIPGLTITFLFALAAFFISVWQFKRTIA